MLLLRRLLTSRGARVTMALFALWLGFQGWMLFEAPRRVEKGLIERVERDGAVNVVVRLAFPPERFHVLKIQEVGRVGQVSGDTVGVRSIDADGIRTLARNYYWITMISSAEAAQKP